jgi:1-phosphofructokinase
MGFSALPWGPECVRPLRFSPALGYPIYYLPTPTPAWRLTCARSEYPSSPTCPGQCVAALLEGGVAVLKISHDQLIADGRARSGSVPDLENAIRELMVLGADHVVVSRAAEPTLSVIDDVLVQTATPTLSPVEPRGGGDSMTAGLATALARGSDLTTALRLGVAAGALNITRRGLGTGQLTAVQQLAERIFVEPVDEGNSG